MFLYLQQVEDKYIKNIHLYSTGGSSSSASGKNSHRSKTNVQSREKYNSSASSHVRNFASALNRPHSAASSSDWSLGNN